MLLWAPGALLGRALGLRRRWALVAAPALTWGSVTAAGVVVPRVGLSWGPWTALGALAVGLAAAVLAARWQPRASADDDDGDGRAPGARGRAARARGSGPRSWALAGAGCATGAALVVVIAWRAHHRLGATAQTWDAVYHADLTTFIAATGDSDPVSAPSALASAGWRTVETYYPAALHTLAALGVRLTGAGAATVLDVLVVLVSAVVVPVAVAALAATLAPARRGTAAAVAAVVAVAPVANPYDQWWRGVWSYGVALPTALLVVVLAVRAVEGRLSPGRPVAAAAAVALGFLGAAGLQPAGAVLTAVLVLGWGLARLLTAAAARPRSRRLLLGAGSALAGAALLPVLVLGLARWSAQLGSLAAYDYTTRPGTPAGVLSALRSVLGMVRRVLPGYGYDVPHQGGQWLLAGVVVVAALVVGLAPGRAGARWLAVVWLLLVLAATSTVAPVAGVATPAVAAALRSLTLFSYNAPFRLVAVVAVVGAVLVGVAAGRVAALLDRLPPRTRRWGRLPLRPVAAVVAAGVLAAVAASAVDRAPVRLTAGYAPRVTGPDQLAVMDQLARVLREHPLPSGATVADDPADGSPWLYALHRTPVLFRHYSPGPLTPPASLLLQRLDDVDTDPDVQQALRDLRVCYVYASDTPVHGFARLAPGFADLDDAASLQLVARQGGAAAYRVLVPGTPCAG